MRVPLRRMFAGARQVRFLSPDGGTLGAVAVGREGLAWLQGRRQRVRVRGESMMPTLVDGDRVLVCAAARANLGALVVFRAPPDGRVMVKRVRTVTPASFSVQSDDVLVGTDSRHFGSVPWKNLIGVVTLIWRRDPRD